MKKLTRGEIAKLAGVNIETIRYYEKRGLIYPTDRTSAGYRLFDEESLKRLKFVKHAKELGFTLNEISELLELGKAPAACNEVQAEAREKLKSIGKKIESLKKMEKTLEL